MKQVQFLIECVDQTQRLLVRENFLLHLVHYVGKGEVILRIGKGMTAARSGMAESQ